MWLSEEPLGAPSIIQQELSSHYVEWMSGDGGWHVKHGSASTVCDLEQTAPSGAGWGRIGWFHREVTIVIHKKAVIWKSSCAKEKTGRGWRAGQYLLFPSHFCLFFPPSFQSIISVFLFYSLVPTSSFFHSFLLLFLLFFVCVPLMLILFIVTELNFKSSDLKFSQIECIIFSSKHRKNSQTKILNYF